MHSCLRAKSVADNARPSPYCSHTNPDRRRRPHAVPQIANAPSNTHQRSQAMVCAVRSGRVRLRC